MAHNCTVLLTRSDLATTTENASCVRCSWCVGERQCSCVQLWDPACRFPFFVISASPSNWSRFFICLWLISSQLASLKLLSLQWISFSHDLNLFVILNSSIFWFCWMVSWAIFRLAKTDSISSYLTNLLSMSQNHQTRKSWSNSQIKTVPMNHRDPVPKSCWIPIPKIPARRKSTPLDLREFGNPAAPVEFNSTLLPKLDPWEAALRPGMLDPVLENLQVVVLPFSSSTSDVFVGFQN